MINFWKLMIIFVIYSFIGYVIEVLLVSLKNSRLTNRGFLGGPICPLYGIGALLINHYLKKYQQDWFVLFGMGALIASILEYVTGWAMEKLFHHRWWDYSENKFNLNGRICLLNTVLFGFGSVLVVLRFHPALRRLVNSISAFWATLGGIVLTVLFGTDLIYSWWVAFSLRHNPIADEKLKNKKLENLTKVIGGSFLESESKLKPRRILNLKKLMSLKKKKQSK